MNEILAITLLVWNVHGIPAMFGGSEPSEIGQRVEQVEFDVFFGQEAWTPCMVSALDDATDAESFSKSQWTAGLYIASDIPKTDYDEYRFGYTTFSRWDFLALKGYQTFLGPKNTMFVNTHFDAGADKASQQVRYYQMGQMLIDLDRHDGPFVIAGDLNLKRNNPDREMDQLTLNTLIDHLNLKIAIKRKLDYVLVSEEITVVEKATLFYEESDHRPLLVKLEIE